MLKDISFGQYYPTGSILHRLDPRVKLLIMLAYVILIFFVKSYIGYILFALMVISAALIARIPLKSLFRSVKAVIFLVLFITIINVFFYKGEGEALWSWWKLAVYVDGLVFASKMVPAPALAVGLMVAVGCRRTGTMKPACSSRSISVRRS